MTGFGPVDGGDGFGAIDARAPDSRVSDSRKAGFNPDQPRDELGRWTDAGGGSEVGSEEIQDLEQSLVTAPDQAAREDLSQLQAIANDPLILRNIDDAWRQSNPESTSPREHGFWISRNEVTGEPFSRPFANPGSARSIVPGPVPHDAIAFFHTHPNRLDSFFRAEPSLADMGFAAAVGLPGLLQSHKGMYYFGPPLGPRRSR